MILNKRYRHVLVWSVAVIFVVYKLYRSIKIGYDGDIALWMGLATFMFVPLNKSRHLQRKAILFHLRLGIVMGFMLTFIGDPVLLYEGLLSYPTSTESWSTLVGFSLAIMGLSWEGQKFSNLLQKGSQENGKMVESTQ